MLIVSMGLVAMALSVVASAHGSVTRVSKGDAQAVMQASGGGGWAVRLHRGTIKGSPGAFTPADRVRIAPIPGVFDDIHYCSLDWHVIALNEFDGNLPGESRTPSEIAASLATTADLLSVDGAPLDTVRTSVRRFLNPDRYGAVDLYYYTTGRVMAPTDLTVGAHTLRDVFLISGVVADTAEVTFYIDAPSEGACL
jgi:hypothetical protein